jgi:hypothetical protein
MRPQHPIIPTEQHRNAKAAIRRKSFRGLHPASASGDNLRQAIAVDATAAMIGQSESNADHANLGRHPARVCRGIVLARSRDHGLYGKLRGKALPTVRSQKHDAVRERMSQMRQWHPSHVLDVVYAQRRALTKVAQAEAQADRNVIRHYKCAW